MFYDKDQIESLVLLIFVLYVTVFKNVFYFLTNIEPILLIKLSAYTQAHMFQPPPLQSGGKKKQVWIHVKKQVLEVCLVDRCHLKIEEMLSNNNIKK